MFFKFNEMIVYNNETEELAYKGKAYVNANSIAKIELGKKFTEKELKILNETSPEISIGSNATNIYLTNNSKPMIVAEDLLTIDFILRTENLLINKK